LTSGARCSSGARLAAGARRSSAPRAAARGACRAVRSIRLAARVTRSAACRSVCVAATAVDNDAIGLGVTRIFDTFVAAAARGRKKYDHQWRETKTRAQARHHVTSSYEHWLSGRTLLQKTRTRSPSIGNTKPIAHAMANHRDRKSGGKKESLCRFFLGRSSHPVSRSNASPWSEMIRGRNTCFPLVAGVERPLQKAAVH
jgi:hypothetical protein